MSNQENADTEVWYLYESFGEKSGMECIQMKRIPRSELAPDMMEVRCVGIPLISRAWIKPAEVRPGSALWQMLNQPEHEIADKLENLANQRRSQRVQNSKKDYTAVHLRADGTENPVVPVNGNKFTLKEAQEYVGGYVESHATNDGRHMFMNEDGQALKLEVNDNATKLVKGLMSSDVKIVGDVLVLNHSSLLKLKCP